MENLKNKIMGKVISIDFVDFTDQNREYIVGLLTNIKVLDLKFIDIGFSFKRLVINDDINLYYESYENYSSRTIAMYRRGEIVSNIYLPEDETWKDEDFEFNMDKNIKEMLEQIKCPIEEGEIAMKEGKIELECDGSCMEEVFTNNDRKKLFRILEKIDCEECNYKCEDCGECHLEQCIFEMVVEALV